MSGEEDLVTKIADGMSAQKFWTDVLRKMTECRAYEASLTIGIPGLEVSIGIEIVSVKNLETGVVQKPSPRRRRGKR